ncbi:MAG TPA: ABC transporter permease subunit, partial [Candidatus Thalassarchaeaceae archaeon]|nr:ABC transporter permease subunit [Candidatus Thalassarchaeaceae archaeon]
MRDSLSRIWSVASKELLDIVRDWRTLVALVLVPLLIFPLFFIALPLFLQGEMAELDQYELSLEVQLSDGDPLPNSLIQPFDDFNLNYSTSILDEGLSNLSVNGDDGLKIRNGQPQVILRLRETQTNSSESWDYAILYDATSELSSEGYYRVRSVIQIWESEIINQTLSNSNLSRSEALDPIHWDGDVDDANVATSGQSAGLALSMFIPMIVAIWTASSAIQPSVDLTAGERERGTLESLLCTPAKRVELLYGKWVAVGVVAATSVLFQMVGLLFAVAFLMPSDTFGIPSLSVWSVVSLLLSVLLFAIFVVAIELALAVRAHSVKEAGTVLGPFVIAFIIPAMFAQFVNLEGIEWWWFVAPIFNVCLAMREALLDITDLTHIVLWL